MFLKLNNIYLVDLIKKSYRQTTGNMTTEHGHLLAFDLRPARVIANKSYHRCLQKTNRKNVQKYNSNLRVSLKLFVKFVKTENVLRQVINFLFSKKS